MDASAMETLLVCGHFHVYTYAGYLPLLLAFLLAPSAGYKGDISPRSHSSSPPITKKLVFARSKFPGAGLSADRPADRRRIVDDKLTESFSFSSRKAFALSERLESGKEAAQNVAWTPPEKFSCFPTSRLYYRLTRFQHRQEFL
jgi:hypothetical protein